MFGGFSLIAIYLCLLLLVGSVGEYHATLPSMCSETDGGTILGVLLVVRRFVFAPAQAERGRTKMGRTEAVQLNASHIVLCEILSSDLQSST
jgi:hypothetical protein